MNIKFDVCLVIRLTLARRSIQLSLFKNTFVQNYVWRLIFAVIIIICAELSEEEFAKKHSEYIYLKTD